MPNRTASCGPLQSAWRHPKLFGERGKSSTCCSKLISHTFFIGPARWGFSFFVVAGLFFIWQLVDGQRVEFWRDLAVGGDGAERLSVLRAFS